MRANLFFKTLNHGRRIYHKENNARMLDMCEVMSISLSGKNYEVVRKYFLSRIYPQRNKASSLKDAKAINSLAGMFHAAMPYSTRGRRG